MTRSLVSPLMPDRTRTPDDVRLEVDRALARAGAEGPRELAVHVALTEGVTAVEALARCGVHVPDADPAPRRIEFVRLPHGAPFRLGGERYRKVSARAAKSLTVGAPNALSIDGGAPVRVLPDRVVERIPTVVVPARRAGLPGRGLDREDDRHAHRDGHGEGDHAGEKAGRKHGGVKGGTL